MREYRLMGSKTSPYICLSRDPQTDWPAENGRSSIHPRRRTASVGRPVVVRRSLVLAPSNGGAVGQSVGTPDAVVGRRTPAAQLVGARRSVSWSTPQVGRRASPPPSPRARCGFVDPRESVVCNLITERGAAAHRYNDCARNEAHERNPTGNGELVNESYDTDIASTTQTYLYNY